MFQLVVLTGILAAGAITAVMLTAGMSHSVKVPTGGPPLPGE
jgi:hypothetical protein